MQNRLQLCSVYLKEVEGKLIHCEMRLETIWKPDHKSSKQLASLNRLTARFRKLSSVSATCRVLAITLRNDGQPELHIEHGLRVATGGVRVL